MNILRFINSKDIREHLKKPKTPDKKQKSEIVRSPIFGRSVHNASEFIL